MYSFCRDVIFVIPVRHTFQSYSHRFVGSTIQAYLLFPILRQVSPRQFTCVLQGIAAGIGISNFLPAFFDDVPEFFTIFFNEEDTTQLSGITELWFPDSPFLHRFAFCCIRHMLPHIWAILCLVLRLFVAS